MENKTIINLFKEQAKAYLFKKPYGFVICGTKGGKTILGSLWSKKKIGEFPMGNGLIAAPTNKILQQATLDTFFRLFPEYLRYYKKQENIIDLSTGGKVYIRSTDEPLAIEGMNLDWAWLDECGMMSRIVWSIAKNKLAISKGQLLGTTNAYYLNWLWKEVWKRWETKEDPDIEVFNWKSTDNPFFPKDFAEKEKARLSPQEYARRYEGRFIKMEGLVWNLEEQHILKSTPELEKYLGYAERVIGGVDWGWASPAGILVAKVKDNKYYIVDEWKQVKRTTADIIQQSIEFTKKYAVQEWYPDPAEPDRIEEMKKAGLVPKDVNKSITLGIAKVGEKLKENKLFILDKCGELIDEISQYRYDVPKDDREFKELPIKANDHLCDSLRYLVIGNELGQSYSYLEEKAERERIEENRFEKKKFELL